jgi:hypothetical protein
MLVLSLGIALAVSASRLFGKASGAPHARGPAPSGDAASPRRPWVDIGLQTLFCAIAVSVLLRLERGSPWRSPAAWLPLVQCALAAVSVRVRLGRWGLLSDDAGPGTPAIFRALGWSDSWLFRVFPFAALLSGALYIEAHLPDLGLGFVQRGAPGYLPLAVVAAVGLLLRLLASFLAREEPAGPSSGPPPPSSIRRRGQVLSLCMAHQLTAPWALLGAHVPLWLSPKARVLLVGLVAALAAVAVLAVSHAARRAERHARR